MFGRDKYTHDATAVVVSSAIAPHHVAWESGGYSHAKYDLILDVYPQGASAWRTELLESFAIFYSPSAGDQIKARCNPETHKVELEVDDDPRYNIRLHNKVQRAQQEAQREQLLAAPPGQAPGSMPPGYEGAMFDPELAELVRLEEEERRRGTPPQ